MNIELPENIRKILLNKEFKVNTVGKTNSQVYMYNNMVLKIQNQSNETENEIEIMQKISKNLPIPKVIEQVDKEGLSYTLTTAFSWVLSITRLVIVIFAELVPQVTMPSSPVVPYTTVTSPVLSAPSVTGIV